MTLRQRMAELHTWGGLLPSWLLFVILFAGTVACFDKELDRWMRPELHSGAVTSLGADAVRGWLEQNVSEKLHAFWMHGPTERQPTGALAGRSMAARRAMRWPSIRAAPVPYR